MLSCMITDVSKSINTFWIGSVEKGSQILKRSQIDQILGGDSDGSEFSDFLYLGGGLLDSTADQILLLMCQQLGLDSPLPPISEYICESYRYLVI